MVRSSLCLCSKITKKLRSCEESRVKLLGTAFSCALCAVETAHSLYDSEHGKTEKHKTLESLAETLKDWIVDGEVIGGSIFGGSVRNYNTRSRSNWKGKQELKVSSMSFTHDL